MPEAEYPASVKRLPCSADHDGSRLDTYRASHSPNERQTARRTRFVCAALGTSL